MSLDAFTDPATDADVAVRAALQNDSSIPLPLRSYITHFATTGRRHIPGIRPYIHSLTGLFCPRMTTLEFPSLLMSETTLCIVPACRLV